MAITVLSSPAYTTPCYNEQWFVASSNQTAQPNFKYRVVITDVISGASWTEDYNANLSGNVEVDVRAFAKVYIQNYLPVNLYGWKKCTNCSRKIKVNIGEIYGSPATYHAGSDNYYLVWNSALELFDFANYNVLNYVYDSTSPTYPFLNTLASKTYVNRSNYLYVIVKEGLLSDLQALRIVTYNASGTILGIYEIPRPDYTTGLYTDQYCCIDVGYKGLNNISGSEYVLTYGSAPIITSNVAYYDVLDLDTLNKLQTITIDCSQFTVYTLHYLNTKGAYNTLHCKMFTELTTTKTTTSYKKSGWTTVSNVKTLDASGGLEKTLSVNIQDSLLVQSDWLTQTEFDAHKDLFTSPDIRLDLGTSTPYKRVKITDNGYTQKNRDRLRNLTFKLEYTHQNNRQIG